ncbi:hypothetical protein NKH77_25110 [Streptomyces sp. M19]
MTAWSPGLSFQAVLDSAPMPYIRERLGKHMCALLDLIDGGSAGDERLRAVAAVAVDAEKLVANQTDREELLRLLPADKQAELAQRLGRTARAPMPWSTWTV